MDTCSWAVHPPGPVAVTVHVVVVPAVANGAAVVVLVSQVAGDQAQVIPEFWDATACSWTGDPGVQMVVSAVAVSVNAGWTSMVT
jgi:hypothetical protein